MKLRKRDFYLSKKKCLSQSLEELDKSFHHPLDHNLLLDLSKRVITVSSVVVVNFPQSRARWTLSSTTAFVIQGT